jgi:cytoskeletal protein CcmA (bactofilin family)
MSHNRSGNDLFIDKRVSKLRLTGGIDCDLTKNQYPDLHVRGGARIKKRLCANEITARGNIVACKSIKAPMISGNLSGAVDGNLIVNECLVINGNMKGDLIVDGEQTVKGDFLVLDGNLVVNNLSIGSNIQLIQESNLSITSLTVMGNTILDGTFEADALNITGNLCVSQLNTANLSVLSNIIVSGALRGDIFGDFGRSTRKYYGRKNYSR